MPTATSLRLSFSPCALAGTTLSPRGRTRHLSRATLLLASLSLAACAGSSSSGGGPGAGGDGDGSLGPGLPPASELLRVRVDPPTVSLDATNSATPEADFDLIGEFKDGSNKALPGPSFELTNTALGQLNQASGRFVANGVVGGTAQVRASFQVGGGSAPLEATAEITVNVSREARATAVTDADVALFSSPAVSDPTRAANVVYPLDGVVAPNNVPPFDVQWTQGGLVRVTLTKANFSATVYTNDPNDHYLVDANIWRGFTQTGLDTPGSIRVDRFDAAANQVVTGKTLTATFLNVALNGSIYYWGVEEKRIFRIDDGTTTRTDLMPNPVATEDGFRCVGCHAVSRSGRYMVGRFGGGHNWAGVFDLKTDLTGDPPASLFPLPPTPGAPGTKWDFSAWNDRDDLLVVTRDIEEKPMAFINPFTGLDVTVNGTLPTVATHPDWSPDGRQIAYISGFAPPMSGLDVTAGNLTVLNVSQGTDAAGQPNVTLGPGPAVSIHRGNAEGMHNGEVRASTADSYPSFSPDSSVIAFANGSGSRADTGNASLYLMSRSGGNEGQAVRLARASPGDLDFQPRFAPFSARGGYFFLSFLSARTYGNGKVGNAPLPGERAKGQIWVTAIRATNNTTLGQDPSEVPYWLPGQNPKSISISAFWARSSCRQDLVSCKSPSDCCSGKCEPDAQGQFVCSPPPPDECRAVDELCGSDAACCGGLVCNGNLCSAPLI